MDTETGTDLRTDLEINRHDLPGEWERQPQLYIKWSEEWAYATQLRDQAKDNLDLVKADIDSNVRANPTAYGLVEKPKPTETAIAGIVVKQKGYEEAIERLHKANLDVNVLAGARSAMDHKRRALENLTTLLVNEFYGTAGVPSQATIAAGKKKQEKQKRKLGNR